jgi:hypothetical protein
MNASRKKTRQRAIVDIESSGLGPDSWPVSIAWHILETGAEGHLLIKPALGWTGWQDEAEEIHGITRDRLQRDGVLPDAAAREIAHALGGADAHSDAPALDQAWMDKIFAGTRGLAIPAIRRYGDLFPGASRQDYQALVRDVGDQQANWKALADVRRLAAAVNRHGRR